MAEASCAGCHGLDGRGETGDIPNLAAQSGSPIELWRIILARRARAVVGDSILYWLSRTVLRRSMKDPGRQGLESATDEWHAPSAMLASPRR